MFLMKNFSAHADNVSISGSPNECTYPNWNEANYYEKKVLCFINKILKILLLIKNYQK